MKVLEETMAFRHSGARQVTSLLEPHAGSIVLPRTNTIRKWRCARFRTGGGVGREFFHYVAVFYEPFGTVHPTSKYLISVQLLCHMIPPTLSLHIRVKTS